jgi:riboflavin kinase/FMN adenylyltransferase
MCTEQDMRVLDWDEFLKTGGRTAASDGAAERGIALTIGVFDGVHRGHQVLLEKICGGGLLSTVVTFRQNPLRILRPQDFPGDIYTLEQKLAIFKKFGVQQTILIDFSTEFSIMTGRAFIDLLLRGRPVELLALGQNFHCGHDRNYGVARIQDHAKTLGVATWVASPVIEGGRRISSSRIRQALAAGRFDEAELLLGRRHNAALNF